MSAKYLVCIDGDVLFVLLFMLKKNWYCVLLADMYSGIQEQKYQQPIVWAAETVYV